MKKPLPDKATLLAALWYDPLSGLLYWRDRLPEGFATAGHCRNWNRKFSGKAAGTVVKRKGKTDYRKVVFNYEHYFAHRIIFQMLKGGLSQTHEIDHIDGNGLNNTWPNLRKVTSAQNARNQRLRRTNKTGRVGTFFDERKGLFSATITQDRKTIKLGSFVTLEEAVRARDAAEGSLDFHQNHGRHC